MSASPRPDSGEPSRWRSVERIERVLADPRVMLGLIIVVSIAGSVLRHLRIGSLWGDGPLWIDQAYRAASGETPYVDFSFGFPPLSLWLVAGAFRAFGATFTTAQIVVDLLSFLLLLLAWLAARRLLRPAATAVMLGCIVAIGLTSAADFSLFSLKVYTPAMLTGTCGMFLLLIGVLDLLAPNARTGRAYLCVAAGSLVAVLSKQEYAPAMVATVIAVAILDAAIARSVDGSRGPVRRAAMLVLAACGPAAIGLVVAARLVGARAFVNGVTAYGQAGLVCPWWPTGIGLVSAIAALAQGVALLAIASMLAAVVSRARPDRARLALWLAGIVGAIVVALYLRVAVENVPINYSPLLGQRLSALLSIRGFFVPFMWWSIVAGLAGLLGAVMAVARRVTIEPERARIVAALVVGASLCARNLFNGTLLNTTSTPISAVPFLLVAILAWLDDVARAPGSRTRLSRFVDPPTYAKFLAVLVAFSVVRLGGGAASALRSREYELVTRAGRVRLDDGGDSKAIYSAVVASTPPNGLLLNVAYAGAMNFAARLRSPSFTTIWMFGAPPLAVMQHDRDLLASHPSTLVVAETMPDLGTGWGLGSTHGCAFPRFVWAFQDSTSLSKRLLLTDYVSTHYRVRTAFGRHELLEPKP